MCGINGIVDFNQKNIDKKSIIATMNTSISHRGPDDEGIYCNEKIALGHRRLSIIDLATGRQPIFSDDESVVIVFNGEIYNYRELKEELLKKDYIFHTKTDTEVVLRLYEERGVKVFEMLEGMFSLAIYDDKKKKLYIARDRAGEKPLYYANTNEFFIFSSELKAIIASNLIKKQINTTALEQYLSLTYIPAPLTILNGIYKLLPGYYAELDITGSIEIKKYWDLKYDSADVILDYNECKRLLRDELFNAVESRMIADVPIGAFLSGGIDSTIVTGIMSQVSKKTIDTFTIGFNEKEFDESDRARIVAKRYKTNHHEKYLKADDCLENLDVIFQNMDEPFADQSAIATFAVSKFAKEYVKAVLTGDAGDELFAGYSRYLINYYADKYNKVPGVFRNKIVEPALSRMPLRYRQMRKVNKVMLYSGMNMTDRRIGLMCLGISQRERNEVLLQHSETDSFQMIRDYYNRNADHVEEFSRLLYLDFKVDLEGDMLAKVDRMSMLNSIETRVPLLSKELVELCARIPNKYKIDKKNQKIIFKDTFRDIVPQELYNMPKRGFEVPVGKWINNQLKEDIEKTMSRDVIEEQGLFDYDKIESILKNHFSGIKDETNSIWPLFVFEKWYSFYFTS